MGKIVITVPKYMTHVELSKRRRAQHFKRGDRVPKKYKDFKFNGKNVLVDGDGTPVIKNPRTAGTPRMRKINGQELYSGNMHPRVRSKVIAEMKLFFSEHITKAYKKHGPVPEGDLPIKFSLEIHTVVGEGNWDLDNLWIYTKVIQDVVAECHFVDNDSVRYITNTGECQFYPVDTIEKRKIVIKIEKDKKNESRQQTKQKRKNVRRDFNG